MKIIANELIPVYETDLGEKVVDGRELHEFLGVGRDFTNWIKDRIDKYDLIEGEDFSPILAKSSEGGRPRTDYVLKLDIAKEVAMMENNEQGKKVRKYFVEVEKRYKQLSNTEINKYIEMTEEDRAIAYFTQKKEIKQLEETKQMLEGKVSEYAPKVAYLETILKSKGTVTTTQIAKDYGLTANELNDILKDENIQYKVNNQWVLKRKYDDKGYTQSHAFDFTHKDGTPDVKMNTRWTQRGRIFIHELLTSLGIKANIEKQYDKAR